MRRGEKLLAALVGLWLLGPFVFLRDAFPFFRYGMFAEPVRLRVQTEAFFVRYGPGQPPAQEFDPAQIGMPRPTYRLLLRNYHYRQQGPVLLRQLATSLRLRGSEAKGQWQLCRVMDFRDTTVVATWPE
jgi:hypothetical protein